MTVTVSTSAPLDGCTHTAQLGLCQENPKRIQGRILQRIKKSINKLVLELRALPKLRNNLYKIPNVFLQ